MVANLMMSAKLAPLGLLKLKVFSNKVYDVITSVHTSSAKCYQVIKIIL